MATITAALPARELDYPESDGKPMAETESHRQVMQDTIATLQDFLRAHPDIHVGGNLLFYYEEGNPSAATSPDVFVVHGIAKAPPRGGRATGSNASGTCTTPRRVSTSARRCMTRRGGYLSAS